MIPFPSVPTDSLYKFKALGGTIAFLTVLILFFTEFRNLSADFIKHETAINLYNRKINKTMESYNARRDKFTIDSLSIIRKIEATEKEITDSKQHKYTITHTVGNKQYTSKQYLDSLDLSYTKAVQKFNSGARGSGKLLESIELDNIKIEEQQRLSSWNTGFFVSIGIIAILVTWGSLKYMDEGFQKWQELQDMSDELARLQLEKTRKEVEGDKPKIILP